MKKYKRILLLHQEWKAVRHFLHFFQKYGPIFTVWMGPIPSIFIVDYELAVESMVKKGSAFVDRKTFYLFDLLRCKTLSCTKLSYLEGRGIVNSSGQIWLEQRRFAIHTLRDFGLGKNIMEERIMLELVTCLFWKF